MGSQSRPAPALPAEDCASGCRKCGLAAAASRYTCPANEHGSEGVNEGRWSEQLAHHARLLQLGEMTAGLAHEVSQRLTAIAGFRAACERAAQDVPVALTLLAKIEQQTARIAELVARTRAFGRIGGGPEMLDLARLLASVLDWVAAEASSAGVVIDTTAVGSDLPAVHADRLQIEQVLLNLLHNAIEALRGAAEPRRITVRAHHAADCGHAVIVVRDTGGGVPSDAVPKLFTPFFTTKPAGLGLGLSISRTIVEAHGGRMWHADAESGAEFGFSLPIAPSGA